MTISSKVQNLLNIIEGLTDSKKLINFYNNTSAHKDITEYEREVLLEVIEGKLREIAPAAATRALGRNKDADARIYLDGIYQQTLDQFDLSGNRVKNGVKTGGGMISGRKFVDVYISYKNEAGWHTLLRWFQDSASSQRYLETFLYQTGPHSGDGSINKRFEVGEEDAAAKEYIEQVGKLVQNA